MNEDDDHEVTAQSVVEAMTGIMQVGAQNEPCSKCYFSNLASNILAVLLEDLRERGYSGYDREELVTRIVTEAKSTAEINRVYNSDDERLH